MITPETIWLDFTQYLKPDKFGIITRILTMNEVTKEQKKILNEKINDAHAALQEAVRYAKEHGIEFYYSGPTYGMGGWYNPSDDGLDCGYGDLSDGWQASSGSC